MQLNHNCLLTVTWTVLLRRVADTRAAASDTQHCRGRVCFPPRQCTSTSRSWHSRASALSDTHFISPDMWQANSRDLNPVDYCIWGMMQQRVYQVPIYDMQELRKRLVETRVNYQHSVVDDAIDQWWKDWKHVSMQKVVTLNTCCDVACLTFKLLHNTTSSFQSHQHLEGNNIPSVRWTSSAFLNVVWWHFSGVVASSQSLLQFVLFWVNVNNEKYLWIIFLKNDILDFPR